MRRALAVAAVLFACTAVAQTAPDPIPPLLKDWRGWVLKDAEFRACPFLATEDASGAVENRLCAWPGRLQVDAAAAGATFALRWRVDAPTWVPLPGDTEHWPQDVAVNGAAAPVLPRDTGPALWLEPGSYDVRGRIPWAQRPQQLHVPGAIGLVDLRVDGKAVAPVERAGDELTLGRGEVETPEADALHVRVFRKLDDTLPAMLETRLQLEVFGQAREETLGPALPKGFVPVALQGGGLSARLDADDRLHVQVQPGSYTVTLAARLTGPLAKVQARLPEDNWDTQEIWSYAAQPALRVTSASGKTPIDPAQAGVPAEWRALPAYALASGDEIAVEQRSRGLNPEEANRLTLRREAWLDFDGRGMYAKDVVSGRMLRGWRLDVAAPHRLERASADGEGLLVTRAPDGKGGGGVELRNPYVALQAGLHIDTGGPLPITGWTSAFDDVSLGLHLPNGYRLIAALGADRASGSWAAAWDLLDVFVVAIVALLAWRLLGLAGAAFALGYLVLGFHEPNAPRWTLFAALAFALLLRALPAGRLQSSIRVFAWLSLGLLTLCTLPFLTTQVRLALYPQLESSEPLSSSSGLFRHRAERVAEGRLQEQYQSAEVPQDATLADEEAAPPPPVAAAPAAPPMLEANKALPKPGYNAPVTTTANAAPVARGIGGANPPAKAKADFVQQRYATNTVIQAGSGEPGWSYGRFYQLSWAGPVKADQSVRLVLLPPWLTRLLRILMVGLLAAAIVTLARRLLARAPALPPGGAAALLLACGLFANAPGAYAQGVPGSDLLNELRARLTEAPKCAPTCAHVARAEVRADGEKLRVALDVHAGERIALPLPGEEGSLSVEAVRVDGAAQDGVAQHAEWLWIALGRGVHRVDIEFRVVEADHVALKFPLQPSRVEVVVNGWQAGGVSEDRLLADTLSLTRERREAAGAGGTSTRGVAQQFPPFVAVQRTLVLDLDWSVRSNAHRVAPTDGGFATSVPVLPGEQVLSAGIKVQNGEVPVSFGGDQSDVSWQSRLERADTLTLTAPEFAARAETWQVIVSPTWHVEFSGVPETPTNQSGTFEFHPLPGEKLVLRVSRPEAVAGKGMALDNVSVQATAGNRALETILQFALRSTQGGEYVLRVPADAEILGVNRGNETLNLRPVDGKLTLPVLPGTQNYAVRMQQAQEISSVTRAPTFALGMPAANVRVGLVLPADRWVLYTRGPAVGPAVLYWGELVVMIVIAWGLARLRRAPLKLHHWLLLGLGFSAYSWIPLLWVVAWLLLLDWRGRWNAASVPAWGFNLVQIGLVLLTVVALIGLVSSIPYGLLGEPDMHVTGNGSYATSLQWFIDRVDAATPDASVLSLPLWAYKIAMLAWALWLANALIGWLRFAFTAWGRGGYWRPREKKAPPAAETPAADAAAEPPPPADARP